MSRPPHVKVEVNLPRHPKIMAAGHAAAWLYVQGLCYCGEYLTDGYLPTSCLALFGAEPEEVAALEEVGLWVPIEGGWQVHDYLEVQRSRAAVMADREASKKRIAAWRERQKDGVNGTPVRTPVPMAHRDEPPQVGQGTAVRTPYVHLPEAETEGTTTDQHLPAPSGAAPLPRVASAQAAVNRMAETLREGRARGANAWNLSNLIRVEFDGLLAHDDIGGCIALTGWYVAELQGRPLPSAEYGRIGQMVKRFGRIALLAIDEAAIKELDDLVSYAFRVAQTMHAERSPA